MACAGPPSSALTKLRGPPWPFPSSRAPAAPARRSVRAQVSAAPSAATTPIFDEALPAIATGQPGAATRPVVCTLKMEAVSCSGDCDLTPQSPDGVSRWPSSGGESDAGSSPAAEDAGSDAPLRPAGSGLASPAGPSHCCQGAAARPFTTPWRPTRQQQRAGQQNPAPRAAPWQRQAQQAAHAPPSARPPSGRQAMRRRGGAAQLQRSEPQLAGNARRFTWRQVELWLQ